MMEVSKVGVKGSEDPLLGWKRNTKLLVYDLKVSKSVSGRARGMSPVKDEQTVLSVVIGNLLACVRKGNLLVYSRDTSKVLKKKSKKGLNVRKVIKAIDTLEGLGYIDNYIGKPSRDVRYREISYIMPTEKFMKEFVTNNAVEEAEDFYYEDLDVLELRDEDKNPLPYHRTPKIKEMEETVRNLNKYLNKCDIKDKEGCVLENAYCRIFNKSFDRGGRWYRADILAIKNKGTDDRVRITINDEKVCEVDYSTLHFRIAAALEGVCPEAVPLDIYSELLDDKDNKVDRGIIKFAVNILFNCSDRGTAIRAINSEINKLTKEEKEVYTLGAGKSVFALISEAYPDFYYLFCHEDNYGMTLQNADSHLASSVIEELVAQDIPVLPVHDSFIVPLRHMNTLIQLMADKFRELFGWQDVVPMSMKYIDDKGELVDEKIVS